MRGYDWSEIHYDRGKGPFRLLLALLSVLYNSGVRMRLLAYRLGMFRRQSLPSFVISVGNLTAGGTGKTPAVRTLAAWALDQGYRPAILSRGYGGRFMGDLLVVSDGTEVKSTPAVCGDEPYLLARSLRGVPVIVSKARYRGGLLACGKLGSDFLILDDGFQHLQLDRDMDIILLDSSSPFGNGFSLPRGPMREPMGQLGRADALILTRWRGDKQGDRIFRYLSGRFPRLPIFLSDHIPVEVVFPGQERSLDPVDLKGSTAVAFSGLAWPAVFRKTLDDLEVHVLHFEAFRDHHVYTYAEIRALLDRKEALGANYLLMTEKDWVKVEAMRFGDRDMGYVKIEFRVLGNEEEFYGIIRDAFGKNQNRK